MQIESLVTAVELFRIDVGRYPTSAEGLEALVKPAGNIPGWNGPYLAKPDAAGRSVGPALYLRDRRPERRAGFRIKSYGGDGKEGGTGEDADISS